MRVFSILVVFMLLLPIYCFAGEIYGTVREHGRPVVKETVTIICQSGEKTSVLDSYGTYRVFIPTTGPCTFQIRNLNYTIRSYSTATSYNFEIVSVGNKQVLRRR